MPGPGPKKSKEKIERERSLEEIERAAEQADAFIPLLKQYEKISLGIDAATLDARSDQRNAKSAEDRAVAEDKLRRLKELSADLEDVYARYLKNKESLKIEVSGLEPTELTPSSKRRSIGQAILQQEYPHDIPRIAKTMLGRIESDLATIDELDEEEAEPEGEAGEAPWESMQEDEERAKRDERMLREAHGVDEPNIRREYFKDEMENLQDKRAKLRNELELLEDQMLPVTPSEYEPKRLSLVAQIEKIQQEMQKLRDAYRGDRSEAAE